MTTRLEPTHEQQAIIAAARSGKHLVIQAGAGTGKTSTLRMVADALESRPAIYIAYNAAIAREAKGGFPAHVVCKTAHALAMAGTGRDYRHRLNGPRQPARRAAELLHTSWLELGRNLMVSPVQLARVAIETVSRFCYSADDEISRKHVPQQNGILGADHDVLTQTVLPYARRAWDDLRHPDGLLRFEHDHYLKMWALTGPVLPADVIMLDEGQDSNPVVAQLVQQQQAQQIAVGDSNQAMYEWRGAVDALANWNANERLYLSQSWRFGSAIADEANKWLSRIGTPLRLTGDPGQRSELLPLQAPKAVLCRTNAEAMQQVISALDGGRRVALVGGGTSIRSLAQAAADLKNGRRTNHPELYVFTTWGALQEYAENEAAGRDLKPFVDLIDAHGPEAITTAVDALVSENRAHTIVSTSHKAKGREWDSVKIADDYPEPKDRQGKVAKSDAMIAYVAVTRARKQLDRGSLAWIDRYHRETA
jgi:hypothetical protein